MIVEMLEAELALAKTRNEEVLGFAMAEGTLRYLETETKLYDGMYVPEGTEYDPGVRWDGAGAWVGEQKPRVSYVLELADLPIGEVFASTRPTLGVSPFPSYPDYAKYFDGTNTISGSWTANSTWAIPATWTSTNSTTFASFENATKEYKEYMKKLQEQVAKVYAVPSPFLPKEKENTWLDQLNRRNRDKRR